MLQVEMVLFVCLVMWMCVFSQEPSSKVVADRYAVFWNRTNPSSSTPPPQHVTIVMQR
ncbi:unnamed protein product, partial [Gadus morhua 'NCC']